MDSGDEFCSLVRSNLACKLSLIQQFFPVIRMRFRYVYDFNVKDNLLMQNFKLQVAVRLKHFNEFFTAQPQ